MANLLPQYLGPPSESLLKKLPMETSNVSRMNANGSSDVYYDYFRDIKELHIEWKESLYEKTFTVDDFFNDSFEEYVRNKST